MVREWLSNLAMSSALGFGEMLGCEHVVDVSQHSIEISMEVPSTTERAWDNDMYHKGQLYCEGYANPIKPVVEHDETTEGVDSVAFEESEDVDEEDDEDAEVGVIPSWRYKQLMEQELVSQLINPSEQWRKIVYGLIGIAGLQFMGMMITLYATGSF